MYNPSVQCKQFMCNAQDHRIQFHERLLPKQLLKSHEKTRKICTLSDESLKTYLQNYQIYYKNSIVSWSISEYKWFFINNIVHLSPCCKVKIANESHPHNFSVTNVQKFKNNILSFFVSATSLDNTKLINKQIQEESCNIASHGRLNYGHEE